MYSISASCVSRPSFPVADAFKDALKEKLGNVFEDLDLDDLDIVEVLDGDEVRLAVIELC